MRFIREFGLVVGGGLAMLIGFLLLLFRRSGFSFGWTAYAPLSDTTFNPVSLINEVTIASVLLAIAGVVALAADVAYRVGRGRRAASTEPSGK